VRERLGTREIQAGDSAPSGEGDQHAG
jgi:hypothetical protein